MGNKEKKELQRIAYAPYETIDNPTTEDWRKSYDALKKLAVMYPQDGNYANTLGYLCYYGRHTGGERDYREARHWFEIGASMYKIESTYKLADMMMTGLGGRKDIKKAAQYYRGLYMFCRDQLEGGLEEGKFADTALRMGRMYHEGKPFGKNDLEALAFLLEARFAIRWRERFGYYGDKMVEKNIEALIAECAKPDQETQQRNLHSIALGRVPYYLLNGGHQMTVSLMADPMGNIRLECRRKRPDGSKPNRILWSVPHVMKCFMTDCVVVYGLDVRLIWSRNPGELIICDDYEYDEKKKEYSFLLNGEVQVRLAGGEWVLAMDEFMWAEMDKFDPHGLPS